MDLRQRLADALKAAMKARDGERTSALRMLRTAFLNKDKAGAEPVPEEELYGVVRSLIKQRHDSATAFRQGGRPELADKETREVAVLESFLPAAPNAQTLSLWVEEAIRTSGATTPRDMGKVMNLLKIRAAGQADMGQLSALVKARLSGQ